MCSFSIELTDSIAGGGDGIFEKCTRAADFEQDEVLFTHLTKLIQDGVIHLHKQRWKSINDFDEKQTNKQLTSVAHCAAWAQSSSSAPSCKIVGSAAQLRKAPFNDLPYAWPRSPITPSKFFMTSVSRCSLLKQVMVNSNIWGTTGCKVACLLLSWKAWKQKNLSQHPSHAN